MTQYKLGAGTSIDLLNRKELAEELDKQTRDWYQERARGLTTALFDTVGVISAGAVSLPSTSEKPIGPHPGWAWALQRISVQGLAGTDLIKVYKSTTNDNRFLDTVTAAKPAIYPGSKGIILRGGDTLLFTGASLSLTGNVSINGEAIEVAELDLYKII